ncbi:MAG: hypothetical protein KKA79_01970, partial [Nanoarchaeota archaeon]|nr:hypothetical protein [Nanoarchaeota archaeon]
FMKKPDRNISMCCGTDLGTQPLTEHEIYMHKQEHHEGPGTEPTISAPSKHREDIIASPPPMPETRAASKEYKDLYEDVFSQIRR